MGTSCGWNCFCFILFGLIGLGIIVYLLFRRGVIAFSQNYQTMISQSCKESPKIVWNYTLQLPVNQPTYDYPNAQALLEMALNITRSSCPENLLLDRQLPTGFTKENIYRLRGIDPSTGHLLMFAYVLYSPNYLNSAKSITIFGFTGTYYYPEWKDDFNIPLTPASDLNNYIDGVEVHRGFYGVYLSIRNELWKVWNSLNDPTTQLIITGHSLGGATSTICAYDFATQLQNYGGVHYAFAPPRSGNVNYAKQFNSIVPYSYRVFNSEDIVPTLPFPIMPQLGSNQKSIYDQCGTPITFTANLGDYFSNHVTAYENYLPTNEQVCQVC